jgi:probable F420-dependent oxidoreductase
MYESLALLSGVAARTSRIKIGTAVLLLAMRDPVITAKTLASIDRLSSGRLTVGVGIGGEFPPEWAAVGVPTRTRAARTDEMIQAMRGLWGAGPFEYLGKRIGFDTIDLHPKPRRPPPIWIGGRSDAAVKRVARLGDGWMGLFLTPERYEKQLSLLRAEAEALARDPDAIARSLYVWTCVADTDAEARTIAENLMGGFYNLPFEKLEKYVVTGSAGTCAERLSEFADAGVRDFAIAIIGAPGKEIVDRLTVDVIPGVRT